MAKVVRFLVAGTLEDRNVAVTMASKKYVNIRSQLVPSGTYTLGHMRKVQSRVSGQWILIERNKLVNSFGQEFILTGAPYEVFARYHEGFTAVVNG